jgi:hypothetical protein
MSGEDALVKEQASGLRRLAREPDDDAHSAHTEVAEEYDALSVSQKSWPPLAGAPRDKAAASEDGAIATAAPALVERRRAGRVDYANPALIELLRGPAGDATEHDFVVCPNEDAESDLAPAKGVLIGVVLGLSMWSAGGLFFWLMR